jgi:hypothetical protein
MVLLDFDTVFIGVCVFEVIHMLVFLENYMWPAKDAKKADARFYISKATFFAFIVVAEYIALSGNPFLPESLGGLAKGWFGTGMWRDLDYRASISAVTNEQFRKVYIAQIAYHSFSTITSAFPGNRTKPEMFFHHLITMILVVTSYFADHRPEGALVLFLHDGPDVFTSLTKCFLALNWTYTTLTAYFGLLGIWMYFRLYLLANYAYSVVTNPGIPLMVFLGSCVFLLFGLHIFWFYLFLKMGMKFAKKGSLPKDSTKHDYKSEADDSKIKNNTKKRR